MACVHKTILWSVESLLAAVPCSSRGHAWVAIYSRASSRQTHLRHSLLECLEREALSLGGALSDVLIGVGHGETDCS